MRYRRRSVRAAARPLRSVTGVPGSQCAVASSIAFERERTSLKSSCCIPSASPSAAVGILRRTSVSPAQILTALRISGARWMRLRCRECSGAEPGVAGGGRSETVKGRRASFCSAVSGAAALLAGAAEAAMAAGERTVESQRFELMRGRSRSARSRSFRYPVLLRRVSNACH